MLNPEATPNYLGSALEWRRMFAEIWGTFLLVAEQRDLPNLPGASAKCTMDSEHSCKLH
jgi:hypothetical protein